ncbi:helix-turn-helix transcriptional regulator [Pseudodesulfovibrio tunisiensis]|uniref:helix-turn-helix transcriptional regulator n=1 Tax=Pseudodesulfovibrio tunisiensis TaxID=463192 RepID=UPI001FB323CD|nr:helix-turn-helix domain-containing protein [Pseudodesulfovibrio tunisiensis]
MERLLDTKEAAEVLRVSAGTLEVWRCIGRGPRYFKIGRRVLYKQHDLEEYVNSCGVRPLESEIQQAMKSGNGR